MPQAGLRRYGQFLETLPDVALVVDAHGTIAFANCHLTDLLGRAPSDVLGRPLSDILPDEPRGECGPGSIVMARHRDGRTIPVAIMRTPLELGGQSLTLCLVRDSSAETELQHRVERFQQLVEQAPEVFYEVSLGSDPMRSSVLYVSPQVSTLVGCEPEAFIQEQETWMRLLHPDDLPGVAAATVNLLDSGGATVREYRIRHHDLETYRWLEDRAVALRDAEGRVVGYRGVARDVTEERWRRHQTQMLLTLGRELCRCQSRRDLIECLADGALQAVEANGSAFATYAEEYDDVVFELGRGVLSEWTGRRVPSDSSVSATVIATGTPWVAEDAVGSQALPQPLPPGVVAYASVPVRAGQTTFASLVVTRQSRFDEREVNLLIAVGELAGPAAQRLELQEQVASTTAAAEETLEHTVEAWARTVELRDEISGGHAGRVAELTVRLARRLGVPDAQIPQIRRGAMLHDVGKMLVPDHILHKAGPLTAEEEGLMRRHVAHAYEILGSIDSLRPALEIPIYHHERWDGSGYLRGLRGEAIPLSARIFAVADVYDAMTRERPGGPKVAGEEALRVITGGSGRDFDPRVVEAMLEVAAAGAL